MAFSSFSTIGKMAMMGSNFVPVPTGLAYTASTATTTAVIISFSMQSIPGTTTYTPSAGSGSGTPSAYTISSLSSNTSYTITLIAKSNGVSSKSSTSLSILTIPSAPTIGTATVTDATHVSVTFTAPSGTGTITGYTVTSNTGSFTGTGTSSPITVTGAFVSGTAYTFTVTATNASGTSAASGASTSVTPNSVPIDTTILVPTGLLIYYKFNSGDIDGSGRVTNYATAITVKNATAYNTPTFSTTISKVGTSSLYLNGSNQYINIDAWTTTQTGITITCWFYFISTGWKRLFDFGNGAGSNNILFAPQNGQHVNNSGGTTEPGSYGNWADSKWHFVAWTLSCDDTTNNTGTWNLYIDNVLIKNITGARYPAPVSRSNNYIGLSNWASDGYSNCYLNEFRFYTRVLDVTEINTLYSNGAPTLSIPNFQSTDITGISTSSSTGYRVYVFKSTSTSYTVSYNFSQSTAISVLAVGGGGGGGSYGSGGGGAGGVVMTIITVPAGSNSITIGIGSGGTGAASNSGSGAQGQNTTLVFNVNNALNITAGGGSGGCCKSTPTYTQYGSGGGGGASGGQCAPTSGNTNGGLVYANNGSANSGNNAGGGGGAGTSGGTVSSGGIAQSGGDGITCNLNGISTFSPSGSAYGTYYWGGGGGGSSSGGVGGNGGKGGGGGGGQEGNNAVGTGGTGGINPGGNATAGSNTTVGAGGANTGGGGGGNWTSASGGAGGSGIVVLAYSVILDGLTSETAAPSAAFLSANGNTTNGTYWINLPTVGPTQVYCILDRAVDGGGWMMAMKATRGTTFQYSSNYWTTVNTLNPTDNTRNDADAKFDTMNYSTASDLLALWPDITTVGGGLNLTSYGCWSWLQNRFTSAGTFYAGTPNTSSNLPTTTVTGITTSMTLIDWFSKISAVRYFIQDAKTWSGWNSSIFSSQDNIRFYGFNFLDNGSHNVRWGFGWNNEGGSWPNVNLDSDDAGGGIGMVNNSYSAGDYFNCCGAIGINTSARVEMYIRDSSIAPSAPTIGTASISGTTATITFTGVTGAAYYTAFSNTGGFSGSSTTTSITITGLTIGTSYTFTVKASSASGTSLASAVSNSVTAVISGVQAFTTINTTTISGIIKAAPSGYTSNNACGLAVDLFQAKMLFVYNGNVCYATSSNSGVSWSAFITVSLDSSTANVRNACGLRNDGQYGYVITGLKSYTVTWTGATPTFTSFDTTVTPNFTANGYFGASMTPDGLTLVVSTYPSYNLVYTRFNGTSFNAYTLTSLIPGRVACAITPDSSTIFISSSPDKYVTITWAGNVGTFSAMQNATTAHQDDRAWTFVGGNYSGSSPPTYIFGGSGNLQYFPWNQSTFTANEGTIVSPVSGSLYPDSINSFSPSGAKGNIIYYVNSANIYTITLNVT